MRRAGCRACRLVGPGGRCRRRTRAPPAPPTPSCAPVRWRERGGEGVGSERGGWRGVPREKTEKCMRGMGGAGGTEQGESESADPAARRARPPPPPPPLDRRCCWSSAGTRETMAPGPADSVAPGPADSAARQIEGNGPCARGTRKGCRKGKTTKDTEERYELFRTMQRYILKIDATGCGRPVTSIRERPVRARLRVRVCLVVCVRACVRVCACCLLLPLRVEGALEPLLEPRPLM